MGSKNLLDKLERVERTINIYRLSDDELIDEVNIDSISFESLTKIVPPPAEDPLLYDGYRLNAEQLKELNSQVDNKIDLRFDLFYYILVCGGVYNW
ncbi:hypothetical protein F0L74_20460 [Chitinophaga agrisoli]|uniref:DUF7683 domain-containing protein n=1 Tax=Chitinophaga agrisoli TaxID=2607653 RepID=A0A5B2VK27_9BACT|nr:hypothetical protein [Chitinophaga agrisoli]KAA2238599.1 hypothetical protein F0L74_20460 [Chitinophaga agrisoli]